MATRPLCGAALGFRTSILARRLSTGLANLILTGAADNAVYGQGIGSPDHTDDVHLQVSKQWQAPVDLVVDHSVQVDVARSENAVQANMELEFQRNKDSFAFLKWGSKSSNMLGVPPCSGVHQGFAVPKEEQHKVAKFSFHGQPAELKHGSVGIAAITSCTNTSSPSVVVGAGLAAKKAGELGLQLKPWTKTSLAPGSGVVTKYLQQSGLQEYLNQHSFHIVGCGSTTCIGNSGELNESVASAIAENDKEAAAVLSRNRNFEGGVHPLTRANYLASPPLVVAGTIARLKTQLLKTPILAAKHYQTFHESSYDDGFNRRTNFIGLKVWYDNLLSNFKGGDEEWIPYSETASQKLLWYTVPRNLALSETSQNNFLKFLQVSSNGEGQFVTSGKHVGGRAGCKIEVRNLHEAVIKRVDERVVDLYEFLRCWMKFAEPKFLSWVGMLKFYLTLKHHYNHYLMANEEFPDISDMTLSSNLDALHLLDSFYVVSSRLIN